MDLDIDKLINNGVIVRNDPDANLINDLLADARDLLEEADGLTAANPVRSFSKSYDAVYAACRAFILASGYRLRSEPDHRSVLQFCELKVDEVCAGILRQFQAAEVSRHHEMYTGRYSIDEAQAVALLERARLLVQRLKPAI